MTIIKGFLRATILAPILAAGSAFAAEPLYCPQKEARIAVLGDSLADGLWASLYRSSVTCKTLTLFRVTEVSDGLIKTDPSEWSERLTSNLGEVATADLVLIQMGANDIRPIRTETGRAMFGTPEWDAAYADRAGELLSDVKVVANDAIWVGLPIVGDEELEVSYSKLSAIQSALMAKDDPSAKTSVFVDVHEATKFGTEGFVQSIALNENMTTLRAPDRIHFTEKGYDMVVGVFRDELERRLRSRDTEAHLDTLALQ